MEVHKGFALKPEMGQPRPTSSCISQWLRRTPACGAAASSTCGGNRSISRTAFHAALELAKIEDFTWHDLRHSSRHG
jgi:hypothetical protein